MEFLLAGLMLVLMCTQLEKWKMATCFGLMIAVFCFGNETLNVFVAFAMLFYLTTCILFRSWGSTLRHKKELSDELTEKCRLDSIDRQERIAGYK